MKAPPTLLLCAVVAAAAAKRAAPRPHILFTLIDDLGHADLGYHLETADREVQTPVIDGLVKSGIELDRHYVHKFCSPTRCAIQSGRAPIHVNVINADPSVYNPDDPVGGFAGIPRNMTGIAEVLARAGYATHYAGKWDCGMATNQHTPAGRGYGTSLSYYHHANDYYTQQDGGKCNDVPMVDLWNLMDPSVDGLYGRPAHAFKNGPHCTVGNQNPNNETCVYEDALFEERATKVLDEHKNKDIPFFLFWATHIVHGPLQVPDDQLAKFSFINDTSRAHYRSMVNWIDGSIGRVVQKTKDLGFYDNLLIIFSSDNGGPISGGATNFPLKGGKFSNWEGGVRVNAFVSGGFVPEAVRGTKLTEMVAGWDWYATLAGLAGADPTDHKAAEAGLPPIDSLDLWPLLSGLNKTSPRTELHIGSNLGGDEANRTSGPTTVGGLIQPPWKILLGWGPGNIIDMSGYAGIDSPNMSNHVSFSNLTQVCGRTPETGCLYNVWADPSEYHNVAAANPDIYNRMLARVDEIAKTVFSPIRGSDDKAACAKGVNEYGGYWGPFIE
eukprot:CAMPEP_0182938072 /NCGR_PEP_ID=MMETSP0105_2-20130417/43199_1 /TAXON_ID=81532 ORGANISM="Acanthoeca-like sp., Strain 10tr" /NCGR_SAMPLE_ID=MMETSP0105_2 /ASSEMBLY_ACC=CAM_ASM_000205 /LENGTH=553 /DNA_ID=CAMNT_0025077337 /DNA_START=14 /DNA_END=1675 /DNA_ORIENTATION=+